MAESHISVGKLGKPHGLSGAFRFLLHRELKNKKKLPQHLFLEDKGTYLPSFIKSVEWLGPKEGFILFEDISSPEKAKKYSGKELFLPEEKIPSIFKKDESIDYEFLIGYTAIEEDSGEIGGINELIENNGQTLLSVHTDGREILIPLAEEFIVKIVQKKKQIILNLPDGLLEL